MDYMNLGRSGLKVSRICLGMMSYGTPEWRDWVLTEEQSEPFMRRALDHGINFFDTADMYSRGVSEEVLGRALQSYLPRDELVIATKVYFPTGSGPNERGLSRKHILDAIDDSLARLDLDYIDLYQIHRWDYDTPIDETLEALHDVVRSGRARYIGASSMYAWQFAQSLYLADMNGWPRFVSMQNHYNLIYREEEREMNPLCMEEGIGLIPWSPLARGFLAGNRSPGGGGETPRAESDQFAHEMYYTDADFEIVDRAEELADKKGKSTAQIALAWLLKQPGVVAPIIGATKIDHLDQAVEALEIKLSESELSYLEEPYRPRPVLGHT